MIDAITEQHSEQTPVTGVLQKLTASLMHTNQVHYQLFLADRCIDLNAAIGKHIRLHHTGNIFCLHCHQKTKKSFGQGYCYEHFMRLASNDVCIMSPEKCHYDQGTCRQPAWGEEHCGQTHYIYLANSSGLKVGITRVGQLPTRWLDQGAGQAMIIARVTRRYLSGLVEVLLKQYVSDKTQWRTMLKQAVEPMDLDEQRDKLWSLAAKEIEALQQCYGVSAIQWLHHGETQQFHYPIMRYLEKINSMNLDKNATIEGQLLGIKGQYLILDSGVINIRRFGGYEVALDVSPAP